MVNVDTAAQYVLTNSVLGSSKGLASTSMNDSLVVVPSSSSDAQSWYFIHTDNADYYRLHTRQKGDFSALDVFNYNGKNSIDVHFYAVQDNTGQHWRLTEQDDGSVKINNQFTGPDIYLDVVKDTLQPTLAARDSPGMHWTLSKVGSHPTAPPSASLSASATASGFTTLPTKSGASNAATASTASPTVTAVAISKDGLSGGVKGGIAAGAVVGVIAVGIGAFMVYRSWRRRRAAQQPLRPAAMRSNPILNVPRRG
ncbi:carbohydrate-binding module family 13 protein [Cucurbitaria berberidis CBS 394.84]|uniref:Carbohydrate-binding module family 13 protein n=1 Tax=Cucurbitaria berberidis CBS 394.84 TaxID=1168544 RepID=A0A9P4L6J4_9PLEO|nr:carbohydrate-binding module family 13 protein [Cucurbitaria berberidis CBS 394.84]KAF1843890.1 carbohydrate-binding module family 13 protein [Cucurbitaria berberidis CBS 394.84]